MSVELTFVNNCNDANNSSIVIFGATAGSPSNAQATALKVISAAAKGRGETFRLPDDHMPAVWIGALPNVAHGQTASPSSKMTKLSLEGLASADIIMTGGGPGPGSSPFTFELANTVPAT